MTEREMIVARYYLRIAEAFGDRPSIQESKLASVIAEILAEILVEARDAASRRPAAD